MVKEGLEEFHQRNLHNQDPQRTSASVGVDGKAGVGALLLGTSMQLMSPLSSVCSGDGAGAGSGCASDALVCCSSASAAPAAAAAAASAQRRSRSCSSSSVSLGGSAMPALKGAARSAVRAECCTSVLLGLRPALKTMCRTNATKALYLHIACHQRGFRRDKQKGGKPPACPGFLED